RQPLQLDVVADRDAARVNLEDLLAALAVRQTDRYLAVEASRAQQRRVQHVRTVGGGQDDDLLAVIEAVHLDQQLVERLFALVVRAAQAGEALAADGVQLVDE